MVGNGHKIRVTKYILGIPYVQFPMDLAAQMYPWYISTDDLHSQKIPKIYLVYSNLSQNVPWPGYTSAGTCSWLVAPVTVPERWFTTVHAVVILIV